MREGKEKVKKKDLYKEGGINDLYTLYKEGGIVNSGYNFFKVFPVGCRFLL